MYVLKQLKYNQYTVCEGPTCKVRETFMFAGEVSFRCPAKNNLASSFKKFQKKGGRVQIFRGCVVKWRNTVLSFFFVVYLSSLISYLRYCSSRTGLTETEGVVTTGLVEPVTGIILIIPVQEVGQRVADTVTVPLLGDTNKTHVTMGTGLK